MGHPSPDKRGIDVCFLYDQSRLDVIEGGFHAVALGYPTRDIVWARFETLKEKKTFIAIACHWPSRGNPSSKREKVAVAVRKVAAFLQKAYGPEIPVMLMGDLNDGLSVSQLRRVDSGIEKIERPALRHQLHRLFFGKPPGICQPAVDLHQSIQVGHILGRAEDGKSVGISQGCPLPGICATRGEIDLRANLSETDGSNTP